MQRPGFWENVPHHHPCAGSRPQSYIRLCTPRTIAASTCCRPISWSAQVFDPCTDYHYLRIEIIQLFVGEAIQGEGHSKHGLEDIICITHGLTMLSACSLAFLLVVLPVSTQSNQELFIGKAQQGDPLCLWWDAHLMQALEQTLDEQDKTNPAASRHLRDVTSIKCWTI